MPGEVVGRDRRSMGGTIYEANAEGKPWSGVPAADEGREEDRTEARKTPKARVGDKQRALGSGHGAR